MTVRERHSDMVAEAHNDMKTKPRFIVCIHNEGYGASLEMRKIYRTVADPESSQSGLIRVIDESGDDYLYPAGWFRQLAS